MITATSSPMSWSVTGQSLGCTRSTRTFAMLWPRTRGVLRRISGRSLSPSRREKRSPLISARHPRTTGADDPVSARSSRTVLGHPPGHRRGALDEGLGRWLYLRYHGHQGGVDFLPHQYASHPRPPNGRPAEVSPSDRSKTVGGHLRRTGQDRRQLVVPCGLTWWPCCPLEWAAGVHAVHHPGEAPTRKGQPR
ncbi:hypothetical protein CATRI_06380 [Corynebacterium atrinae]|nr:hypothetical protein CATRI_06380 [Corynebacterium atrinae]